MSNKSEILHYVKLGYALKLFVSNIKIKFWTIDMIDLFPLLKYGLSTKDTICSCFYIYIIHKKLYNKLPNGQFTFRFDDLLALAFNDNVITEFFSNDINLHRQTVLQKHNQHNTYYDYNTLQVINMMYKHETYYDNGFQYFHVNIIDSFCQLNCYTKIDDYKLEVEFDYYQSELISESKLMSELLLLFNDSNVFVDTSDILSFCVNKKLDLLLNKLLSNNNIDPSMYQQMSFLFAINDENVELVRKFLSRKEIDPRRNSFEAYRLSLNKHTEQSHYISEMLYHSINLKYAQEDKIIDSFLL